MSNGKKKNIVISASMAILAVHAMNVVAKNADGIINIPEAKTTDDLAAKIDAAVARPNVKEAVSASFTLLAMKFGHGDISLGEKYFPGASDQILLAATTTRSRDFTSGGCYSPPTYTSTCHAACHGACHSACHGSRSWR